MKQNTATKIKELEPLSQIGNTVVNYVPEGYARGAPIPWQLKLGLKITLATMPFSYRFLSKLGIFKHGDLAQSLSSLYKGFNEQIQFYKNEYGRAPRYCLELGPGDSLGHVILANAYGCEGMWLNDVGDFATTEPEHYREFSEYIIKQQFQRQEVGAAIKNFERKSVLKETNSIYGTEGLKSLKSIPSDQIDFSCSNAVWEHISRDEFKEHMHELYRVHKSNSVSRHYVDLHDHLGGALNNLRFSPQSWEGNAVHRAGFYTNRLTMKEMVQYAQEAGFDVSLPIVNKWKSLPTEKSKMHKFFHDKSEEELNVCTFLIVLRKH